MRERSGLWVRAYVTQDMKPQKGEREMKTWDSGQYKEVLKEYLATITITLTKSIVNIGNLVDEKKNPT